jgi:hypothetical protein
MQEHMDRLAENRALPSARSRDLKFLFTQASLINEMRDRIAHYGGLGVAAIIFRDDSEGFQHLSNEGKAGRIKKTFTYKLDAPLILNMVGDLVRIRADLNRHTKRRFVVNPRSGDSTTWLYRSPQPMRRPRRFAQRLQDGDTLRDHLVRDSRASLSRSLSVSSLVAFVKYTTPKR